jgi:hypothetical protein
MRVCVRCVYVLQNLNELLDNGVKHSRALLLVQTAKCLHRPWTLLQVYEALRLGKPVICVHVAHGGYDFQTAKEFLADLRYAIEDVKPGAYDVTRALLHERGISWTNMQRALYATVPNSLSISLHPGAAAELTDAAVREIVTRYHHLCKRADSGQLPEVVEDPHSVRLSLRDFSSSVESDVDSGGGGGSGSDGSGHGPAHGAVAAAQQTSDVLGPVPEAADPRPKAAVGLTLEIESRSTTRSDLCSAVAPAAEASSAPGPATP